MQTIDLGLDFLIIIPSSSPLALPARLSLHEALSKIERQISDYRSRTCPFTEWLTTCLRSDAEGREPSGKLFASYQAFCSAGSVPDDGRLSLTAFGRQLTKLGLGKAKDGNGRVVRHGCRLLDLSVNDGRIVGQTVTDSCAGEGAFGPLGAFSMRSGVGSKAGDAS